MGNLNKWPFVTNALGQVFHSLQRYSKIAANIKKMQVPYAPLKALEVIIESNEYLFNPQIQNHTHINLSSEYDRSLAGQLLVREEATNPSDKPLLRNATSDEIVNADSLVIGGIYGDDIRQISALLKAAKILAVGHHGNNSEKFLPLAIFPECSREDRYEAAVRYTSNPQYSPVYIEDRVREHLLPKIRKNLDSNDNKENLSLFSFSMGGREIMMMQNALRNILDQELSLSENTISSLMNKVNVVCLGYAPSLAGFEDGGFNKIAIFSMDDRGVLIPHDLYEFLLTEEITLRGDLFITQMHNIDEPSQYILINGASLIKPDVQDYKDHTITHYMDCVASMPEDVQKILGDYITCGSEEE